VQETPNAPAKTTNAMAKGIILSKFVKCLNEEEMAIVYKA
jgi:hypothetical protein